MTSQTKYTIAGIFAIIFGIATGNYGLAGTAAFIFILVHICKGSEK